MEKSTFTDPESGVDNQIAFQKKVMTDAAKSVLGIHDSTQGKESPGNISKINIDFGDDMHGYTATDEGDGMHPRHPVVKVTKTTGDDRTTKGLQYSVQGAREMDIFDGIGKTDTYYVQAGDDSGEPYIVPTATLETWDKSSEGVGPSKGHRIGKDATSFTGIRVDRVKDGNVAKTRQATDRTYAALARLARIKSNQMDKTE